MCSFSIHFHCPDEIEISGNDCLPVRGAIRRSQESFLSRGVEMAQECSLQQDGVYKLGIVYELSGVCKPHGVYEPVEYKVVKALVPRVFAR